jgi:crossover junction endodeoxyribonuclease RuvC
VLICGLDPGVAGAYALLGNNGLAIVDDLPLHQVQRSRSTNRRAELDLHALRLVLLERRIDHVFIERTAARPGQGVTSMFRYGYFSGTIYGLVVGLDLPVTLVLPQAWQKHHGVGPTADAARQRAVQLYPAIIPRLRLKRDAHRADALLIADYGLRQRNRDAR